jgi:hypothetical protein
MGENQDTDFDFADTSEEDSRQAIETQKRILKQWQTMLTGSKYLFSNWAEMNRRVFSRALKRLSDVQAEPDPNKQNEMMGTVASENMKDYVEEIGRLGYEWAKVAQKLTRSQVTAAFQAARDSTRDKSETRERYDDVMRAAFDPEAPDHGKSYSYRAGEREKKRPK